MIKATTTNGFEFEADPEKFHTMKVLRRVGKINQETSIEEIITTMEMILGEDQTDALCDFCDEIATKEKYADKIFGEEIGSIFGILSKEPETKN